MQYNKWDSCKYAEKPAFAITLATMNIYQGSAWIISGGEGKASGAILGVLVIGIFSNGMGVLGVNDFVQQAIQGCILLFALFVEFMQKKAAQRAELS